MTFAIGSSEIIIKIFFCELESGIQKFLVSGLLFTVYCPDAKVGSDDSDECQTPSEMLTSVKAERQHLQFTVNIFYLTI